MGCCCKVGIPNCLLPTSCFGSWVIFRCGPPADQSEAGDNCFVYNKYVLVIEIESVAKPSTWGQQKRFQIIGVCKTVTCLSQEGDCFVQKGHFFHPNYLFQFFIKM